MGRVRGKPQVICYMRQTLSWMRKKKTASLMVRSVQIYLDDQHVATQYQTVEDLYQKEKERLRI